MKVLVIPDVHLKPNIFRMATTLMKKGVAEQAVCLMDIADDWNQEYNLDLYEETYDEAISFAKQYPNTSWCYGNHDLSYLWNCVESGYSGLAAETVRRKLLKLNDSLSDDNPIKYVQRIDNVLFSHGGVSDLFVRECVENSKYNDIDSALETINGLRKYEMWVNDSPIWLRPQYSNIRMYKPRKILQVVGHTPIKEIYRDRNIISCDVFSTYRDGSSIGSEEFLLLDTLSWEYQGIK